MRKTGFSLSRLLLEAPVDYDAVDRYLSGEFVINGPDDPAEPPGGTPAAPMAGNSIPAPPIPPAIPPLLQNFEEKFNKAKAWFASNKARGAELSAGLLNAEDKTLMGFQQLAAEATRLDSELPGPPFHQFAATCLVTEPGGYAYVNEFFNAVLVSTEIFFGGNMTLGKLGSSDKFWIALPGVLEGLEAAFRNGYFEDVELPEFPGMGDNIPDPSETAPAPAPIPESFLGRHPRRRYSLVQTLFEASGDDLIKAAVRELLGSEIADLEGTIAEKMLKALIMKPELDRDSVLEGVLQRIKEIADRRGVLIENNDQLKKFISENAESIFDNDSMSKYVNSFKRDVNVTAMSKVSDDLVKFGLTEAEAKPLIEKVIDDLDTFYKSLYPDATVTPIDKKVVADTLADVYRKPGLSFAQQKQEIQDILLPKWRDAIENSKQSLLISNVARSSMSDELFMQGFAERAALEIESLVTKAFRASGVDVNSAGSIGFSITDSMSGVTRNGFFNDVVVVKVDPVDMEGFEGVPTYLAKVSCTAEDGKIFTVRIEDYLAGLRESTDGFVTKSMAANERFQVVFEERLQRMYSSIDAEISTMSPSEWAQFMNKAIDDSATDNLLKKPISDVARAANIERDYSVATRGLLKAGRALRTMWKDVRKWWNETKRAQDEVKRLTKEEALALAVRKRNWMIALWAILIDEIDEPIENAIYIMYVSEPDAVKQYLAFGAARSSSDQMLAGAKRAIRIASHLVEKFSTPSVIGGDAPMKAESETVVIAAADAWEAVSQNITSYAQVLISTQAASAAAPGTMPESHRRLRAVIRESILLDTIRRIRR